MTDSVYLGHRSGFIRVMTLLNDLKNREDSIQILIVIITMVALTLAAGCDVYEPFVISYVMSLEVGNLWEYSVNGYEVDSGDTTIVTGTLTRTIVSETTHAEGFQLYKMEETIVLTEVDSLSSQCYYLRNELNELRVYDDTTSAEFYIPFKYNSIIGDKWMPGSDPNEQIEIISVYNSIDVPAGNYWRCICTKKTNSSIPSFMHRFYWGNQSEGIVCFVEVEPDVYLIYELTSISLM